MLKGSFIRTISEALDAKVDVRGAHDCWPWTGQIMRNGYGRLYGNGRHEYVHVAAYERAHGQLGVGLEVDHSCHTPDCRGTNRDCLHRRCVNPAHLVARTHRENTNRGNSPAAVNSRRTHCAQGHAFTDENTYVRANGRRSCRACHRRQELNRYHRRAAESA